MHGLRADSADIIAKAGLHAGGDILDDPLDGVDIGLIGTSGGYGAFSIRQSPADKLPLRCKRRRSFARRDHSAPPSPASRS